MAEKAKQPPFTKDELTAYIAERGYTADVMTWYDWYEKTEFCYVQGRMRIPLKNWKADVNMKLRHGKFSAKPIIKPQPKQEKPEETVEVASLEQRQKIKSMLSGIGKRPFYGFRSNKVLDAKRRENLDKMGK